MATKKAKVDSWVVELCNAQIEKVKGQTNKAAFVAHQPRILRVLETVKEGGNWEDVQKIFHEGWLPATLNGGWFPLELQRYAGRIVEDDVAMVKVSGPKETARYEDIITYEVERGHKVPDDMEVFSGRLVKCAACDNIYSTRETAHQFYCQECRARMKPGNRAGNGVPISKMDRGQLRKLQIARSVLSLVKSGGPRFDQRLAILNGEREKAGLQGLSPEQVAKTKEATDLWS